MLLDKFAMHYCTILILPTETAAMLCSLSEDPMTGACTWTTLPIMAYCKQEVCHGISNP